MTKRLTLYLFLALMALSTLNCCFVPVCGYETNPTALTAPAPTIGLGNQLPFQGESTAKRTAVDAP